MRATRAIIHLSSFQHNLETIKTRLSRQTRLCVPVKADAYGHGAVQCAGKALESGADFLGVATVTEGAELRDKGIAAPILLFGPSLPEEIPELARRDITPFVFESRAVKLLNDEAARQGKTLPVHLKVDTGMGRIGCSPDDAPALARLIQNAPHLVLEGVCTHFAASDSLAEQDRDFTREQLRRFHAAVAGVKRAGVEPGICHCANSGAMLLYPETRLDMVRPGIMAYGYYPGDYCQGKPVLAEEAPIALEPVMDLVTQISAVKTIPPETSVSYGRRWVSPGATRIATLPLGYADGLSRRLSAAGLQVAIGGQGCPVRGTICMDQCMADLSTAPEAEPGQPVIVFGAKSRGAWCDAGDLAEMGGTIPYEVLTAISKRVPRIYRP